MPDHVAPVDPPVPVDPVQPEATGAELIAAERRRQVEAEGWAPEHDDEHTKAELARAAHRYLTRAIDRSGWPLGGFGSLGWPWSESWWKPSDDPIRNLVKAGALIAAEIDRLQRAEARHA